MASSDKEGFVSAEHADACREEKKSKDSRKKESLDRNLDTRRNRRQWREKGTDKVKEKVLHSCGS